MNNRLVACLIEDNRLVRESLAFTLRDHGFEVEEAADGREGLDLALSRDFDIVLTDLDVPSVHGLAIIQHLRAAKPHLPVVAFTGATFSAEGSMVETAKRLGADVCLPKPFKPGLLVEVMNQAIAHRREAQIAAG
jgi:two-component system chemotaxis response regulator CheY